MPVSDPSTRPAPRPRSRLLLALAAGVCCGALAAAAAHALWAVVNDNFAAIVPGRFYRAGLMSDAHLVQRVQAHGIRTVIDLRAPPPTEEWRNERSACLAAHQARLISMPLWGSRLPTAEQAQELLRVLDSAEPPVLIHCLGGADRTGVASALVLLLYYDADVPEARGQLSIRFGHLSFRVCGAIAQFLTFYEEWLTQLGRPHTPDRLRYWVQHIYRPVFDWDPVARRPIIHLEPAAADTPPAP